MSTFWMASADFASTSSLAAQPDQPNKQLADEKDKSGSAIPSATRRGIEQTFGVDLSATRIHTDTAAAESADALSAHAFTVGQDIYFGAGSFAPGTREGDRLLAHELAHVAQGSAGPQCKAVSSEPGDAAEVEADRAADLAVANIYDGGTNRVQLSATPSATHMRKGKDKPSIAAEATRRESTVLSLKTPARPSNTSAFYQLMTAMGQQGDIDALDREYMIFAGMLPFMQLGMDRVTTLERETGLSASSPESVKEYFQNMAKKGESNTAFGDKLDKLATDKDSVSSAMDSGTGGLQTAIMAVQQAHLKLDVALNEARIDALKEDKADKESQAGAIVDRYQLIVDTLTGMSKLVFSVVTFDYSAISGAGSAVTADGSPLTELANAGAEAAAGSRLAMLDSKWLTLQQQIGTIQSSITDATRTNLKKKIEAADLELKTAWALLRGRQKDIAQTQQRRRNSYVAIGQAGDKAKVGGGADTSQSAAEGHGEQIMLLVAGIRERALMVREVKSYISSAGFLTNTAAQKKWFKEYDSACRDAGPHNQGYLFRTGLGYVKDDGSCWEHDACTKHIELFRGILDAYYNDWTKEEAAWVAALSAMTTRKTPLEY